MRVSTSLPVDKGGSAEHPHGGFLYARTGGYEFLPLHLQVHFII